LSPSQITLPSPLICMVELNHRVLTRLPARTFLGLLVYQSNNNYRRKGFHIYGNFLLTGSPETTESADNDPDQTPEMNFNIFYTLWENNLDDKYALIGPVISVSALRTSVKVKFTYQKVLCGHTQRPEPGNLRRDFVWHNIRIEIKISGIKAASPRRTLQNGSRIFVGAVFNMAYNKHIVGKPETASIYLSWHVPFGRLWNVNEDE